MIRDNGQYIREKASMDFQTVTDELKTWTKARVMPGF
ncbi:Beta-N-acetylglucosaminidase, partial [Lacticaseibacillus paracasei subsp. paracasei Lpp227]